ncbi:MAG: SDR family oxidoreductase [Pseudomonadota bacterium]
MRVLITGAGTGIGRACALYLAEQGHMVIAAGRRAEPLETLAAEAKGEVRVQTLDVTDPQSIEDALPNISPVEALINNAGVSVMGSLEGVGLAEWRRQYEVNVFGVVAMIQAVLPQMRQRGGGRIVTIGSVTGRLVPPFMGAYGSSKHALEGITDALRREVKAMGIHVSLVRPGFVNTAFGEQEQASLKKHEHDAYTQAQRRFAVWHHDNGHKSAPDPKVVAVAVERALTETPPRTRYAVPASAIRLIGLRNWLPAPLIDRIMERTLKRGGA